MSAGEARGGDGRLRALQRRWQESGVPEDGASYFSAALRAGVITRRQLDLAADLGLAAARLAGGREAIVYQDPYLWARELRARWGLPVLVRASLAATRLLLARGPALAPELSGELEDALAAAGAWADCPCDEHRPPLERALSSPLRAALEAAAGRNLAEAVRHVLLVPSWDEATHASFTRPAWSRDGYEALLWAADAHGSAAVREAVARALAPWALAT